MQKYTLRVGDKGKKRLKLLNKMCNPSTIKFLNEHINLEGMHVLDVGCGIGITTCKLASMVGDQGKVTAVDISKEQLEIAKNNAAKRNLHNIEFIVESANNLTFLEAQFNLVYCRFLLSHVQEKADVVGKMISLLKENGYLVCEELSDVESPFVYPESAAFNGWKRVLRIQNDVGKVDYSTGKKLYGMFRENNLSNVDLKLIQPIITMRKLKDQLWLGVKEVKETLIKANYTPEQIKALITDLQEFASSTEHIVGMFAYIQIIGQKKSIPQDNHSNVPAQQRLSAL